MDQVQRDFEASLQRSLIRRARREEEGKLVLFRQPWWAWVIAALMAIVFVVLAIGISLIA